jgi:hypothetical protein
LSVTENTENEELPQPRLKRRRDNELPQRPQYRNPGRAQVWVFILGGWRQVFADDNRAAAEKYAREQVRFGGAVTCIEIRERGNGSTLIWKAGGT